MSPQNRWYSGVAGVAAVLLFLDRLTKFFAQNALPKPRTLIPEVLNLTYIRNEHFLFFWEWPKWFVVCLTAIVVLMMVYMGWREYQHNNRWHIAMLAVIFIGAISNLFDRIWYGYVIDFIDVPFWSVFNFADMYIVGGVLFLLVSTWKYDATKAVSTKS